MSRPAYSAADFLAEMVERLERAVPVCVGPSQYYGIIPLSHREFARLVFLASNARAVLNLIADASDDMGRNGFPHQTLARKALDDGGVQP